MESQLLQQIHSKKVMSVNYCPLHLLWAVPCVNHMRTCTQNSNCCAFPVVNKWVQLISHFEKYLPHSCSGHLVTVALYSLHVNSQHGEYHDSSCMCVQCMHMCAYIHACVLCVLCMYAWTISLQAHSCTHVMLLMGHFASCQGIDPKLYRCGP